MFLGIMFVLSTVQVGAQAFRDEVEDSLKAFSVPPFYCKTLMTLNDTHSSWHLSFVMPSLNDWKSVNNEPYGAICGITKEELLTQMSDDIDELAQHLELNREETVLELKKH